MADEWTEAGSGSGDTWQPENAGDTITGVYKRMKENVGRNNSRVYMIQEDGKDEPTSVWGSTVLDTKMGEIPEGSQVKIEYLGKEKGSGIQPYKNFKVLYKAVDPVKAVQDVMPGAEEVI